MRGSKGWLGVGAVAMGAALVSACGGGEVGEAVRPKDPTAAGALGDAACHDPAGTAGEPLIADWKPEQRGDLEVAMKDGVAVVAYTCKSITILSDCHLDGKYGFIGMTRKEQVVQLANSDELSANLPLTGASLSSSLERGMTLDIAMIMVGKKRTTWEAPTKADLKGKCDGATHYVRGATVGAFAMDTGTQGKVRAAGELFTASASGSSASAKKVQNKDGDVKDCANASPDADKAPAQCGTPIRLLLTPIAAAPAAGQAPKAADAASTAMPKSDDADTCPAGLVKSAGKCTTPASAPNHQCRSGDVKDCTEQCDKGNAASCAELGYYYGTRPSDASKAPPILKKACDAGDVHGCALYGGAIAEGIGGAKIDLPQAVALAQKTCGAGDAFGCRLLGRMLQFGSAGLPKDEAKAFTLYRQSCEGGDSEGCAYTGALLLDGVGTARDLAKGAEYKKRACEGGNAPSCADVGGFFETGKPFGKNEMLARAYYERACFRDPKKNNAACTGMGRVQFKQNPQAAKFGFVQGCTWGDPTACLVLKVQYGENRPLIPDMKAQGVANEACTRQNDARACGQLALFQLTSGLPTGKATLQRACQMGDAFSCQIAPKFP